jgi:hypothetical protein
MLKLSVAVSGLCHNRAGGEDTEIRRHSCSGLGVVITASLSASQSGYLSSFKADNVITKRTVLS